MKTLLKCLALCLLLSACAPSGKESAPNAQTEQQTSAPMDSAAVETQARLLSRLYLDWKLRTQAISWKESDPAAFTQAQAYVLAQQSLEHGGTSRISILVWLLGKFQNVKDSSADSAEMKWLAQAYLKKELNL